MWLKKLNPGANPGNIIKNVEGRTKCCGDEVTVQDFSNTATNLTANNVTGLRIDGADYAFTEAAATPADLYAGVNEAMKAAGYVDVENAGTRYSGTAGAAVVNIITSGAPVHLINGSGNVNLTV